MQAIPKVDLDKEMWGNVTNGQIFTDSVLMW